jgi:hypothetical protein
MAASLQLTANLGPPPKAEATFWNRTATWRSFPVMMSGIPAEW